MFTEMMALISIAMLAIMIYNVSYIRFLAPIWIIFYVVLSGRAVTSYGLFTIIVFVLLLLFFLLEAIRIARKKADKNRGNDDGDDSVSLFDEDDALSSTLNESESDSNDDELPKKKDRPKRTKITEHQGTLLSHGFAPYKDIIGNDKSYFVNCDGKTFWGIGLKEAIKNCGAENGDTIRFYKQSEVRTKKANVFDEKGKVVGTRSLSEDKRRGIWVMEVISN